MELMVYRCDQESQDVKTWGQHVAPSRVNGQAGTHCFTDFSGSDNKHLMAQVGQGRQIAAATLTF